ncbi:MAG: TatD family hydrolase [Polyangiales bacterium]
MRAFDSHCHLDLPAFDADREAVWARAIAAGVVGALIPRGVAGDVGRDAVVGARGGAVGRAGDPPYALPELSDAAVADALDALPSWLAEAEVVAVGECGLDGTLDPARASMDRQREVFASHLRVAARADLPLVLHVRGAHREALEVLGREGLPSRAGVVHSYSGGVEHLRAYLDLGLHLAFGGAITRPRARRPVEALKATPAARLLLETDAPDQPVAGVARGEPADLVAVLTHAAAARGVGADALGALTMNNALSLFGVQVRDENAPG